MGIVEIEQFDIREYESVLHLRREIGLTIRPGDDFDGIRLKLQRDPDLFLVAKDGGVSVGSVMGGWDGRRGWIYHLAVKTSRQRQGVAKELMEELESRLIAKGAKRVNAQIYGSNTTSLRFFQS